MKIKLILGISIIAIIALWLVNPIGISFAQNDFIYNPSQQFIKDFFLSLSGNANNEATELNSTVAFRRLYAIKETVDQNDMLSAWQMLVSLPQIAGIPEISNMKLDASAIQSAMPWYADRELRKNFIDAFEEIWLKNKNLEDYGTFKEVFGGYASRRVSANPAVYIRDNLGYYGYTKSSSQPSDDLAFIQDLFISFSRLSEMSLELGYDYHSLNLNELSNALLRKIASRIDDAWRQANALEKAGGGNAVIDENDVTESSSEILSKVEPSKTTKIDFSQLNVFKLPENAAPETAVPEIATTKPDESSGLLVESSDVVSPPFASTPGEETAPETDLSPLLNGSGLEPPEEVPEVTTIKIPSSETAEPKVEIPSTGEKPEVFDISKTESTEKNVEIVKIEKTEEPAKTEKIESEQKPENVENIKNAENQKLNETEKPTETAKTESTEEPLQSVFVTPKIEVVNPEPVKPAETEKPSEEKPVESTEIKSSESTKTEETKSSEEVDLLKNEQLTTEKPVETKPTETKSPETKTEESKIDEKKPVEKKTAEKKSAEVKAVETKPTETKPAEIKPNESKPEEAKPVETKPMESKPLETKAVEPKPAEIKPSVTSNEEARKIAEDLTNQIISSGEELGKLAVDLVILWSNGPESIKDYATKEADLEEKFRVGKEEFLSLLYVADIFKLEDDLGLTFDTYNGKIIAALMKGYDDFKKSGGLDENPGISDEELLRAVGQLTEGVESRRDSIKIQNASLRAFRARQSQLTDVIAKLEKIKNIKIPE